MARKLIFGIAAAVGMMFMTSGKADACSRVNYHGADDTFVIARCLDWKTPIPTNLYVYPAGIEKESSDQPGAIKWTSKYGAVYAVGYDGGITEGMNEKGLVVNGLFCKGTVYSNPDTEGRPPMSLAMFVGWLLDLNATTDECVAVLQKHDFNIGGATFDGGTVSALHWGITDASGKSVIVEFDNGEIKINDMGDYWAMTNDPQWPSMRAIIDYWGNVGGVNMLPGTVKSPDRCVRANFFAHHVEATSDPDLAVNIARTVLVNSCVPYTYLIQGEPNVSSTQWRSYADIKNRRYFFDIVTNFGIYYVDLTKCDLRKGAPILKLDTSKETKLMGEANHALKHSNGFTPMY
ncbi:MAG: linear amide C-N hydrolase [Muribaculaceae bacterium]|nr:linear amide C-N hydrolase [Muribaculaceae bacterium]